MNKQKLCAKDIPCALCLMLLIISFAVIVSLNFRQLYYWDIKGLDIPAMSGYSEEVIRENYDVLIDYNSMFNHSELKFPTLAMSEPGRIHFEEVKDIFVGIQRMFLVTLVLGVGIVLYKKKQKSYEYLKLAGIMTVVIPTILGILIAINWEWCFVTFHHIAFDNDYWIFDPAFDPIIMILPDQFFMHCAIMILAITITGAVISYILGQMFCKKNRNSN